MKLFLIKSFKGGLSDWENVGVEGSFKFGSNLDIRKDTDSLSCTFALETDLSTWTNMTALAKFIVPCSDGNTYFFCDDGKILKRTSAGVYSLVYTDPDGAIKGAFEWGNSSGHSFLYWATATKLHRKQIPGATNWSDVDATVDGQTYPKTNLTSATWHTMKQINGQLLIANGSKLAMVGYDDSYTNEALSLTPNSLTKCLMEYKGYAYAGTTSSNTAQNSELFVWDTGQSLNWNAKNTVPTNSINAIINGEYPIMQVGTNGQLLLADISSYTLPIVSFKGGGQVNPEGVEIDGGIMLFGSYGNGAGKTGIYSYGRKKKNAGLSLNLEYVLDCTEIGAIKKVGTDLLVTYKDTNGTGYGVKKLSTTTRAVGTYESLDLKFPISDRETLLTKIRLVTMPLPASTSIQCYRKMDKTGSFTLCELEGGATAFNTTGGQEAVFLAGDYGKIAEIKLVLTPDGTNTPEVLQAELYFE